MRMTDLKSGNQSVVSVMKWNQQYLSTRMRLDIVLACLLAGPGLGCPDGSANHLDFCGTCAEGLSVFRSN